MSNKNLSLMPTSLQSFALEGIQAHQPGEMQERRLMGIRRNGKFQIVQTAPIGMKTIPRNKPCPCGSGTKFKKCCWNTTA